MLIYLFAVEQNYTDKISGMVGGTKVWTFRSGTYGRKRFRLTHWNVTLAPAIRQFSYLLFLYFRSEQNTYFCTATAELFSFCCCEFGFVRRSNVAIVPF